MAAAPATVRVWSTGRARLWLGYGLTRGRPRVARARARRRLPLAQGQRPHFLAGARKARDRKERSNQMRASPQRAPRSPATRFACRFSLRCSTSARYARLRGTAQREALLCRYGTEGRLEPERTARNHIQRTQKRTYKGCEPRATLGVREVGTSTPKGFYRLSPRYRAGRGGGRWWRRYASGYWPVITAWVRGCTGRDGDTTLSGLAVSFGGHTQGSSRLATLG